MITENHVVDSGGSPAGGTTFGRGFAIGWQNGPLGRGVDRKPQNGAFVEEVIQSALGRIRFYQSTKFKCAENDRAIDHLCKALDALVQRTSQRESDGVEGTHQV